MNSPRTTTHEAFIIAVGLARLGAGIYLGFRPFDDTYITFRYARNLAAGFGFVYNIGEHVLGTTTPLWTMVLAVLHVCHIPLEPAALVLSLAADVVTAVLIFRIVVCLGYALSTATCAAVLFLSLFDYFSLSRSGMETAWFVLFTVLALEQTAARRFRWAGAAAALACLTRPEGVIASGVVALALLREPWRERVSALAVFLALTGAWVLFALYYFGSPVPQSIVAKASSVTGLEQLSWQNLLVFFATGQYGQYGVYKRTYFQLMPVMTILAGRAGLSFIVDRAYQRMLIVALFPAAFVIVLAAAHAFTYFTWYYGPIYPFLAMLAAMGMSVLAPSRAVPPLCAAICVAQLGTGILIKLPNDREDHIGKYQLVARGIPADRRIAIAAVEIGIIGWQAWPARVIDLEGLVTPDAVGVDPARYVELARPDYVVLPGDNNAVRFLRGAAGSRWFANEYALVASVPNGRLDYQTYRRQRAPDP